MTLGGLALAVGILVDEATVEIENIHAQMQRDRLGRPGRAPGQRGDGRAAAAGDALHSGGVRARRSSCRARPAALFVPLSLAVGFAMIASYILSSTFVPVLSVWLLQACSHDSRRHADEADRCSTACAAATNGCSRGSISFRWLVDRRPIWSVCAA